MTGQVYRLPSESESEFAARGGIKAQITRYAGSNDLDSVGKYSVNASGTNPVGSLGANEAGLYDMSGNVWV